MGLEIKSLNYEIGKIERQMGLEKSGISEFLKEKGLAVSD